MGIIELGSKKIKYEVIRSDRKTLGINIEPDRGVIVRSPHNVSERKIKEVVEDKSSWILKKLKKVGEIKPPPGPREYLSGEKLSYLGRRYRLKVIPVAGIKKVRVKLYQGKFNIDYPAELEEKEEERKEKIRKQLISWYREHASKKIKERVEKYKGKVGVEPNKVKVKKQKKRWGSCSSKGNLNINWRIIMAPMSIVDYIVVHELVHLKHSNHSKDFWQLVETILPDYQERKEWLRVNGRRLEV